MQAGKLSERIELQQFGETRDPTGGVTRDWSTTLWRWAEINTKPGREQFEEGKVEPTSPIKITIRYYDGIDATWRVKYGTRIFNIESPPVNVGEKNIMIELYCREVM